MPYRHTAGVQARLDARRGEIVAAALDVVAEGGYAALAVREVAARAGVATGTVARYGSKAELATQVFALASGREVAAVRRAAVMETGVADQLAAVVATFAGRALRARRLAHALLTEPVDPAVEDARLIFRRAFRDLIAELVAAGVAAGELRPVEVEVVAAGLVGAIGEALVGPLAAPPGEVDEPRLVAALTSFCVNALEVARV